jgi:hypothetical protein
MSGLYVERQHHAFQSASVTQSTCWLQQRISNRALVRAQNELLFPFGV